MSLNPRIPTWQGRRVWLVGASSGMGRAAASLLHARGAHVTVSARSAAALEDFVAHHPGSTALPLVIVGFMARALRRATPEKKEEEAPCRS